MPAAALAVVLVVVPIVITTAVAAVSTASWTPWLKFVRRKWNFTSGSVIGMVQHTII